MEKVTTQNNGFHLMEILTTLAIIGILAALGMPLYSQYFIQENRLEAITTLTRLALAMEKYHVEKNTYQASLTMLNFPDVIARKNYQLLIQSATEHDYLIMAKPIGKQRKKDTLCATLTLNSLGEKGITGPGRIADCW